MSHIIFRRKEGNHSNIVKNHSVHSKGVVYLIKVVYDCLCENQWQILVERRDVIMKKEVNKSVAKG